MATGERGEVDAAPPFRILHQDDWLVAIDKPEGVHVHPPEDSRNRITRDQNGLARLRDQIGQYLYPVHRLDPPTSGVLVYALSSQSASRIAGGFAAREVQKEYWAVVRGKAPERHLIERPLKRDSTDTFAPASTEIERLSYAEFDPVHRYSWILARPKTGVYHQIRRHLAGLAHPLVGDVVRGDGKHNRFFRNDLGLPGLYLRAMTLCFRHPESGKMLKLEAGVNDRWRKLGSALPWQGGSPLDKTGPLGWSQGMSVSKIPLVIEFAPGSRIHREESDRAGERPSAVIRFGNGHEVPMPSDQVVLGEDHEGSARVGLGGMSFEGLEGGDRFVFWRVRDIYSRPEETPETSDKMTLDPSLVSRIWLQGEQVYPRLSSDQFKLGS